MVDDIRGNLNYNYKITSQKFRETSINAERFGTAQVLYDNAERNIKTLEDLIAVIRELKKDRKFDLVDSYSENNAIVKVEVKAENLIREIREKGINYVELEPGFIKKTKQILDIYDEVIQKKN
jgi:16S rRNA C1402 (ribose-2'-O) methylase RsmI